MEQWDTCQAREWRKSMYPAPLLERLDVHWGEKEPLAIRSAIFETIVPVLFDAEWIIRFNCVDERLPRRESDSKFAGPSQNVIGYSDLVPFVHADQVDEARRAIRLVVGE